MAHAHFVWNELLTDDVEKAKAFFTATIGWSFSEMNVDKTIYWIAKVDGKPVAGLMDMRGVSPPGVPPRWFSYIAVDDVDARIVKAIDEGGRLVRPARELEGVGRVAIVADPTGAVIGWMTPQVQTS